MKKSNHVQIKNIIYFFRNLKIIVVDGFFWILFFGTLYFAYMFYKDGSFKEHLTEILTPLSIFAVFLTYKENVTQQRKEQVNSEIDKILDAIQQNREILNELVDFANITKSDETLSIKQIHLWICENDNGKIEREADGFCKMSKNGRKIRFAIINILNAYEKLAIGVYYKAIDEKMALDAMGLLIVRNYKLFKEYIKHHREKHNRQDAWEFLEWLYNRWNKKVNFD